MILESFVLFLTINNRSIKGKRRNRIIGRWSVHLIASLEVLLSVQIKYNSLGIDLECIEDDRSSWLATRPPSEGHWKSLRRQDRHQTKWGAQIDASCSPICLLDAHDGLYDMNKIWMLILGEGLFSIRVITVKGSRWQGHMEIGQHITQFDGPWKNVDQLEPSGRREGRHTSMRSTDVAVDCKTSRPVW